MSTPKDRAKDSHRVHNPKTEGVWWQPRTESLDEPYRHASYNDSEIQREHEEKHAAASAAAWKE